jgi:uncharacterized protein DUF4386
MLLVGGLVLNFVVTAFHPSTEDPNDHPAAFAEYAADGGWKAVHLGQFAAAVVVVAGLVALYRALARTEVVDTVALLALAGAIATTAAVAVLQAIDGIALKQTVDAWASAAPAEKADAFRDAEVVRWIEWGANAFFRLLEGVTLVLYGLAIVRSAIVPSVLGWVAAVVGGGYLVVGVIVGYEGFSDAALIVGGTMDALFLVLAIGIAISGWRRPSSRSA